MPSIITRGVASALAFGFGGGAKTLTTETFTANGTWVAPVGVSMVTVLSGKGSAGVSDYIDGVSFGALTQRESGPLANAAYLDYSTVYAAYLTALNAVIAGGLQNLYYNYFAIDPSNRWRTLQVSLSGQNPTYIVLGQTPTNLWLSSGNPTSGNVLYTDPNYGFNQTCQAYREGNAGTAASALGQTFPGGTYSGTYPNGTGTSAATTTYTNISVTPGTSYSIVVPSGGQVQISYFV